jgi:Zn-dependent protease
MTDFAVEIALAVVAGILAITLHEAAHGYAALALGDDTARVAGRLSLNPLRHIDRTGTILLPGALAIGQLLLIHRVVFMFGWAKPVPVAAWKFANPRRGMAVVAAAGPAMNFFLAWLGALSLHLLPNDSANLATGFVEFFILYNLVLGLFNLLPIPPLDGGRIVVGLLPEGAARAWAGVERAGIVIVLFAVFLLPQVAQHFGYQFNPIESGLGDAVDWARRLVMTLAGHGGDMGADDGSLTI